MIRPCLIVAVSLLALLAAGCSRKPTAAVRHTVTIKTTIGSVDIDLVEELDPRMKILSSLDRQISVDGTFEDDRRTRPDDSKALLYLKQIDQSRGVDQGRSLLLAQHQRLKDAEQRILTVLAQRLAAADQLRLDAVRNEKTVSGDAALQTLIGKFDDQAAEQADQDRVDSARVASLKMQISAMKLNEAPPPTAPSGHWAALEASREAQLVTVIAEYDSKLKQIFDTRNKLIQVDQAQLAQSIDTQMQQQSDEAANKRAMLLEQAEHRFSSEQAELAAEDESIFDEAETLTREPEAGPALVDQENVKTSSIILRKYRSQLEAKILTDAYATVASISQDLHLKIVRQGVGVKDVTAKILQSARDRSWKLS